MTAVKFDFSENIKRKDPANLRIAKNKQIIA